jgi:hypothetical protein
MEKLKGFKKGYDVVLINRTLTIDGVSADHALYEITSKKFKGTRVFITEGYVRLFIDKFERDALEKKALKSKSAPFVNGLSQVATMGDDLKAEAELRGEVVEVDSEVLDE